MRADEISRNSVARLYQYRKSLYRLKRMGFVKVFSENLTDAVDVTAAQVRRDFMMFGLSGNKRGGYNIDDTIRTLDTKLGKGRAQNVIVIGMGNIGRALVGYKGFIQENIRVIAGFDNDPAKIDRSSSVPVLPMSELKDFVHQNQIEIAVLAVPELFAQQVLDDLVKAKIKGVLNFAPIRLVPPTEDFVISHVDLGLELETVIYLIHSAAHKKPKHARSEK